MIDKKLLYCDVALFAVCFSTLKTLNCPFISGTHTLKAFSFPTEILIKCVCMI